MSEKSREITKRVDLNLGFSCNEACRFCYYIESVESRRKDKDLSTAEAKHWLRFIRKKGATIVDFTGGEPTIRNDLLELVKYAREIGFQSVCVITNGLRLAQKEYAKKLIEAGVDDFLFSLHGPTKEMHDSLTQRNGSFENLLQAINNVRQFKVKMRSNTVVTGLNYSVLDQHLKFLLSFGFQAINFILFNPIVEAGAADEKMNVKYSLAGKELEKVVANYADTVEKITIRYLPLCCLPRREKYITNMGQIQYDPDEWDYLIRTRIREGWFISSLALFAGFLLLPSYRRIFQIGWSRGKREAIKRFLEYKNKVKAPVCKQCRYEHICAGVWRNYAKWAGFSELKATPGKKIIDPQYFMR